MPIQQKCSFHFHKRDENTISPEICTFQVLLINLHFKECKGFIWKKQKTQNKAKKKKKEKEKEKKKKKKDDDKRRNRALWSPLFFRWYESRIQ